MLNALYTLAHLFLTVCKYHYRYIIDEGNEG